MKGSGIFPCATVLLFLAPIASTESQRSNLLAEVTVIAYDASFEMFALTNTPEHHLPLVLRVDRVLGGVAPAKYLLANYQYQKNVGQEWPDNLRAGIVRLRVQLSRQPACDSTLEDVLTRPALDKDSEKSFRIDRLRFLVAEDITASDGLVPCYEFDRLAYHVLGKPDA